MMCWQVCTTGATLWQNALALYNKYDDMVFKDPASGKKVFFVPDNPSLPPDASIVARACLHRCRQC